jgi:hypothetical protein
MSSSDFRLNYRYKNIFRSVWLGGFFSRYPIFVMKIVPTWRILIYIKPKGHEKHKEEDIKKVLNTLWLCAFVVKAQRL